MVRRWSGRRVQRLTALVLDLYGTRCHLCGQDGATTADHLLPRSLGGSDALENLRPAHKSCNSSRGAKPVVKRQPAEHGGLDFFSGAISREPRAASRSSRPPSKTGPRSPEPDQRKTGVDHEPT